jgi:hypothetical protein
MDQFGYEFTVGIGVGKLLAGALCASALFRSVALTAGAGLVCYVFSRNGVDGILDAARVLQKSLAVHPSFSKGALAGAVLAFITVGLLRKRSS